MDQVVDTKEPNDKRHWIRARFVKIKIYKKDIIEMIFF